MSKVSEERERSSIDRDLSSSDDELRRLAVERLLELPLASAIPRLVESLGDSSWRVRKASVQRIVACSESSEVVGALLVFDPVEGFGQEAVRWVNGQPVSLGWPLHSYAKSISGDGGVIVGKSDDQHVADHGGVLQALPVGEWDSPERASRAWVSAAAR